MRQPKANRLLSILAMAFFCLGSASAQPAAPNYGLSLGGTNGFLELTGGAFNDLEEVTLQGWVKSHLPGRWWNPAPPFGLLNAGGKKNLLP